MFCFTQTSHSTHLVSTHHTPHTSHTPHQYILRVGFHIAVVNVADPDEGVNGFLKYEVISPVR